MWSFILYEGNHDVYNSLIYCYIFTVLPIVQFFLFTAQLCNSRTATLILFPSIFSYKIYCVRSAKPQTLHRLLFRMQNQRFTFNIRTRATFRELYNSSIQQILISYRIDICVTFSNRCIFYIASVIVNSYNWKYC